MALITRWVAMVPEAPTVFSMTTGWPRRSASLGMTSRAATSTLPPAENGTTATMGWLGQAPGWACAKSGDDRGRASIKADARRRVMGMLVTL